MLSKAAVKLRAGEMNCYHSSRWPALICGRSGIGMIALVGIILNYVVYFFADFQKIGV
jgi:hypothetical protein